MCQSRQFFIRMAAASMCAAQCFEAGRVWAQTPLRFDFHSAFWENLHHRLYIQAQAYEAVRRGDKLNPRQDVWSAQAAESWEHYLQLSATQRTQWERALRIYSGGLADQDLLGGYMPTIDAALARIDDGAKPTASDELHPRTVEALVTAAPIYRATLWETDDAANRSWISSVSPLVASNAGKLTSRLRAWYQSPWPDGPYRVDVTRYANWAGCYTNTDPIHIIMSSRDFLNNDRLTPVRNAGTTALEMVFHEASHTVVTQGYGTIGTAIENAATELGKPEPDGLWHAVIFYTTGRAVVDEVSERYQMFADAVNVYNHSWTSYRQALLDHWQPYLDHRRPLGDALKNVVAAVS